MPHAGQLHSANKPSAGQAPENTRRRILLKTQRLRPLSRNLVGKAVKTTIIADKLNAIALGVPKLMQSRKN